MQRKRFNMVSKLLSYQTMAVGNWTSAFAICPALIVENLTMYNSSPAPMTLLHEMYLERPDLLRKHEVYIDGGVTRGTDVIKALCLGARAVGLGRAFLFGNGVWGEPGVHRVIQSEFLGLE